MRDVPMCSMADAADLDDIAGAQPTLAGRGQQDEEFIKIRNQCQAVMTRHSKHRCARSAVSRTKSLVQ